MGTTRWVEPGRRKGVVERGAGMGMGVGVIMQMLRGRDVVLEMGYALVMGAGKVIRMQVALGTLKMGLQKVKNKIERSG